MSHRRSRLAALIAAAGVATALASPAAAAAAVTVTIQKESLEFADAFVGDIETRVGPVADVTLTETFDGARVLVYSFTDFAAVTCGDGSDGLVGTAREGQTQDVTFAFDRRKVSYARASGTIAVTDFAVDTCSDTPSTPLGTATVAVSLNLTGTDPILRDSFISKSGIPGFFLQRWPEQLRYRQATGSITIDGVSTAIAASGGFIGYSHGVNHVILH